MKASLLQKLPVSPFLLVLILILAAGMSGCTGEEWVAADQLPTSSATSAPTASPVVEDTPTEVAAGEVTVIADEPTSTPTGSPTATLTRLPSMTSTPLPPEAQLATLMVEWGGTPTRGPRPTSTRPPTRTPTITPTPTVTPTPTPPFAMLRIGRPGALSKLVSPFKAEMFVIPGEDGRVQVDLIGEDGRFITRQLLDYHSYAKKNIGIYPNIEFKISAVAETARLVLSTNDRFGRKIFTTSTDVVLLSVGENEINPPALQQEPYLVRSPKPDEIISGGVMHLNGLARPVNDNPLVFELIDQNGQTVGRQSVKVDPPSAPLSHTPFSIDIPYKISDITPVRLSIRQESATRIPGTVALTSMTLTLIP